LYLTSLDRNTAQLYPIAEWRANEKFFNSFHADPSARRTFFQRPRTWGADLSRINQGRSGPSDLRRELERMFFAAEGFAWNELKNFSFALHSAIGYSCAVLRSRLVKYNLLSAKLLKNCAKRQGA